MTFSAEQKAIAVRSELAILITAAAVASAWLWLSPRLLGAAPDMATADRLAYALKADLLVFLWLAGCLRAVASIRFRSDADRPGSAYGAPSSRLAVPAAVLQNTLEQTVLAVGSHLVLATVLRGEEMVVLPVLVALYLIGRMLFAHGYARARRPGSSAWPLPAPPIAAFVLMGLGR